MSSIGDIDVALVAEGTYPYGHGGVTVWCDQLVRGLPDQRFTVTALTGSGDETPVLALPDNVAGLTNVPIWRYEPGRPRAPRGALGRRVDEAHRRLLDAIGRLAVDDDESLLVSLREMHDLSERVDMSAALRTDAATRRVHQCLTNSLLGRRGSHAAPEPTVGDALWAGDLLEHFLRALWAPPPQGRVTHCVSHGMPVLVGFAAKWRYGVPLLLTEHGVYLRERYLAPDALDYTFPVRAFVLRFMRLLTGAGYRTADLVTPGSEYNRRWQVRIGADPAAIQPVHNGVDPALFPGVEGEPDVPTLAWAGRIDPIKDLETLIRAFAKVRTRVPGVRLRMFGPTPPGNEWYRERCDRLIADLGLGAAATFEGRVPEITDAYRAGHVVVLSSASEGFPYTVIEAMASARATVSTDVGGVREAVGDAGLVVPPRSPDALAIACVELLRDDVRRRALAIAARARILERFTLARFLDVYREIYRGFGRASSPGAIRSEAARVPAVAGVPA